MNQWVTTTYLNTPPACLVCHLPITIFTLLEGLGYRGESLRYHERCQGYANPEVDPYCGSWESEELTNAGSKWLKLLNSNGFVSWWRAVVSFPEKTRSTRVINRH